MPRPQLVLLMGIPASGKSTFAALHMPHGHVRISLDMLHTRAKEAKMFSDALSMRQDVVVDNTNVLQAERQRFIGPAKEAGYEVTGYFFRSVISECLRRNALRTGNARIPDVGVIARSQALELPSLEEGFDRLYYVSIADGEFAIDKWKDDNEEKYDNRRSDEAI